MSQQYPTLPTDTALVALVLNAEIVFPVLMLDEPLHTATNGYQCKDHTCPCYAEATQRRNTATLNGNRPFSLLR